MNILVSNHTFGDIPGGSETYAYCIINELVKQGHRVGAFCTRPVGKMAKLVNKLGVPVHRARPFKKEYDLILASHTSTIKLLKRYGVKGFYVQTCHGIYPELEQPCPGMDAYAAITQEVKDHLMKKGYESTIIHNGVDCNLYKPASKINNKLTSVLSLCHSDDANNMVKIACRMTGVKYVEHNKYKNPVFNLHKTINEVDLVVTLGRGAYESLACGRSVVIFDKRAYVGSRSLGDGIIQKNNIDDYIINNCSGRYSNKDFTAESLAIEFSKYNSELGNFGREYAVSKLNIETQVHKYIALKI
jgi:hypothetical protein